MKVLFVIIFMLAASANAARTEINRILFSSGGVSWSKRDYEVYRFVLTNAYKKKKISKFTSDELNDFILSRMAAREGETFGISYDKENLSDQLRKKTEFTKEEIEIEIERIGRAIALTEIKESYHQDSKRFNAWFDVMKRKYQVKMKSINNTDINASAIN